MDILYVLGGIAGIFIAIKAIDWAISVKYKTKSDCSSCQTSCREKMYDKLNGNRDLLVELNSNVKLLMDNFELKPKQDNKRG